MEQTVTYGISKRAFYISLNCPVDGNLFCAEMMDGLFSALTEAEGDREADLVIIRSGQDGVFSGGHNINKLNGLDHVEAKHYNLRGQRIIKLIRSMKKPVLALVDGDCFGPAFELILSCDMVFATERSRFAFPETEHGFMPGFGGTQLASRKIYETFVKYLVFTGDSVSPEELFEKGIVTKVFTDHSDMDIKASEFAELISKRSSFAIGLAKETINNTVDMDFDKGLLLEQNAFTFSFSTHDKHEGTKAFGEKREPEFKDRWEDYRF
ncbi:Enoyl-CoA hydratase/isomerase [Denitrovibrio acetiphilus DSM 12809]|uniref:Enoyl-CoA hydratase/isomerase n=1 Tax=Denitrovibrio acetiphilus (strain DSM 12809 / NBRC 114555 / N2460) TaxID=522772 RepID=D4H6K9_DENA2|nr:enoyl-CoA hydratase/isomerase family protein [Denitrovibrio acetiphilus]ADD69683.1 Enoyl-CoA hydratase/isomerase [Denitrovibrio acetiphilus DSM 12809]